MWRFSSAKYNSFKSRGRCFIHSFVNFEHFPLVCLRLLKPILLKSQLKQPGLLCLLQNNNLVVLYIIEADYDSIKSDRVKGAFDSTNLKKDKIRQIAFDKT